MNGELKPARSRRTLFRWIVFAVIGAVIGASALTLVTVAMYMYPLSFLSRLYVFLSPSNEFRHYLGKCMEIHRGQTKEEVLAIMTEFQIASQKPNSLVFNTEKFSADFCSVRLSDEAGPHVVSVEFEPD